MDIKNITLDTIYILLKKSKNAGNERYRKAFLTSLMNVISQVVQLATGLISIPLTLNYLGPERFGIWMTLSTALTFITLSDFGVGIGLQDKMSKYIGLGSYENARKAFFSSLFFILLLFCVFLILIFLVVPPLNLSSLFSLKSSIAIKEIISTTQMVIFVLGLGLLAGVVQRTFAAFQEGFLVAVILIISRISSLILLVVVVHFKMSLPALVFVFGGVPNILIAYIGLFLLKKRNAWLFSNTIKQEKRIDWKVLKEVLKVGMVGLGATVAIYLVNNSTPFLIARKYGAENVSDYAVLLKLLSIPSLLLTYLLQPLWPAITDAKIRSDSLWIKSTYERCKIIVFLVTISFSVVFLFFGREIIHLWTQNEAVVPGFRLLVASVSFMVLGFWNTLTSVLLNGLSRYKSQATYGVGIALLFVFIAAYFPADYGKESVVWIITVGFFIRCMIMQVELSSYFHVMK